MAMAIDADPGPTLTIGYAGIPTGVGYADPVNTCLGAWTISSFTA